MYRKFLIFPALLSLCIATNAFAQGTIDKNLSLGMNDPEVLTLQQDLNALSSTNAAFKIALSGAGSPGNESTYFGLRTQAAVKAFQSFYASAVLAPAGLSSPTGFVGSLTRAKINALLSSGIQTTVNSSVPKPTASSTMVLNDPYTNLLAGTVSGEALFQAVKPTDLFISSISGFNVKPGDTLTIKGRGFLASNILHIGTYQTSVASSNDVINFTVPSLALGTYEVWIENTNGSSQTESSNYITIAAVSVSRPIISRAYPLQVSTKTQITFEGTGFDPVNNTINSSLGTLKNIPSQNGKISFNVGDLPQIKQANGGTFPDSMPVTFTVSNSQGKSADFGRFTFSAQVAEKDSSFLDKALALVGATVQKISGASSAFAYGRSFDGDPQGTEGIDTECTCSGGTQLKYNSIIDHTQHYYLDEPGLTTLVGSSGGTGNFSQGNDYLNILYPYGICLVEEGEDCQNSDNQTEATLYISGADLLSGGGGSTGGGGASGSF